VTEAEEYLVDWPAFFATRQELGADFIRILGYFREDGTKSVAAIETATRARDAVGLVLPAHTLKGEARQFGAEPLSDIAEAIETIARRCVETHEDPGEVIEHVVKLRPMFEATLTAFERECNPLVERKPGFGRKVEANNQGFGRI